MTEPGTCDVFTTDTDYVRPYVDHIAEETTGNGWILRHIEFGSGGPGIQLYHTQVIHPWRGVLSSFYWSQP